jgi:acyl carrier protein
MDDVRARLTRCFQTVFQDVPAADIPNVSVETTTAWDSIASLNLLTVIEEEFGVSIDFEELEELNSFSALERYLAGKAAA